MTTHDAATVVYCHVALKLSRAKWVFGIPFPGSTKITTSTVVAGDTTILLK
jgi:hypothetical protein